MNFYKKLQAALHIQDNIFGCEVYLTKSDSKKKSDLKFTISNGEPKKLTIYIDKLTSAQEKKVTFALKEYFAEDGLYFISSSSEPLLERLYKYRGNDSITQTSNFFKKILSDKDWQALRDSLYLRAEFNDGKNISDLKRDIIMRFGERGNMISNLCTAGYFEEVMMPLYNFDPKEFYTYYDLAVDRGITALFVNNKMNVSKIASHIKQKITSAKAYGQSSFHIHGIGKQNIKRILQCLEKEKSNLGFVDRREFNKNDVMVVEIIL